MTTHRHIQLHNLQYALSVMAAQARRAAGNLARIGNDKGAGHYLRRAGRLQRMGDLCRQRLRAGA